MTTTVATVTATQAITSRVVLRFRDFGEDAMGAAESEFDKIAHISLPLFEGTSLMASDVIGAQGTPLMPATTYTSTSRRHR
jgi:hypothetical protein